MTSSHHRTLSSTVVQTSVECNDGTICENSSTCTPHPIKESKYMCDCTHAKGDNYLVKYAGVYCEHASTSFCQRGVSTSEHAFCTNGGECKLMVGRTEEHAGCKCPMGYEGHYCQFVRGSKPSDWGFTDFMHPALVNAYGGTQNGGSSNGAAIAVVIGSCVGLFLLVGLVLSHLYCGTIKAKLSRSGKEMDSANGVTDTTDFPDVGLGGRRSSVASPNNASFVGGKSVYKKKNSTAHFVTADTLEADGAVLKDAMGIEENNSIEEKHSMEENHSTSMDEVDLEDGPNIGEMA